MDEQTRMILEMQQKTIDELKGRINGLESANSWLIFFTVLIIFVLIFMGLIVYANRMELNTIREFTDNLRQLQNYLQNYNFS